MISFIASSQCPQSWSYHFAEYKIESTKSNENLDQLPDIREQGVTVVFRLEMRGAVMGLRDTLHGLVKMIKG